MKSAVRKKWLQSIIHVEHRSNINQFPFFIFYVADAACSISTIPITCSCKKLQCLFLNAMGSFFVCDKKGMFVGQEERDGDSDITIIIITYTAYWSAYKICHFLTKNKKIYNPIPASSHQQGNMHKNWKFDGILRLSWFETHFFRWGWSVFDGLVRNLKSGAYRPKRHKNIKRLMWFQFETCLALESSTTLAQLLNIYLYLSNLFPIQLIKARTRCFTESRIQDCCVNHTFFRYTSIWPSIIPNHPQPMTNCIKIPTSNIFPM